MDEQHDFLQHIKEDVSALGLSYRTRKYRTYNSHYVLPENNPKHTRLYVYEEDSYKYISFTPTRHGTASYPYRTYFLHFPGIRYTFNPFQGNKFYLKRVSTFSKDDKNRMVPMGFSLPNGRCMGLGNLTVVGPNYSSVAEVINAYWATGFNVDNGTAFTRSDFFLRYHRCTPIHMSRQDRIIRAFELWESDSVQLKESA